MPDMLRRGSEWLEQMRTTHASSPVEYRRGGQPVVPVSATFGKTDYEIADEAGLTVGSHVWDFLIRADELGFEPQAGDVIAASGRKYEVMNLGGEGCWRFSDSFRQTYRIHTRDTGGL